MPSFGGEAIRLAELDRRIIARGKYDLDVVGHYARPDVFSLTIDTKPQTAVNFGGKPRKPLSERIAPTAASESEEGDRQCSA